MAERLTVDQVVEGSNPFAHPCIRANITVGSLFLFSESAGYFPHPDMGYNSHYISQSYTKDEQNFSFMFFSDDLTKLNHCVRRNNSYCL